MNIEKLRSFCLSLPAVTEDIKWGHDLCFSVGAKMFAVTGIEGPFTVSFKVTPEQFGELSTRPGIVPAPYMARNHWVLVEDASQISETEWTQYLEQSYELVKSKLTKKLQKELGLLAS
ncbi:MmcQ/YjbR family DNA-binding protein [Adhaeribacter sp. BT258]|uniref:MmcQ/YjbR family DNA-binding protein n=1 Tax=Adhaeribacter terrigena TaxID=2793070 RepID=A0ABS1C1A1_9BACT|nr:MmcQ/YjbR family DNA-binding protein [Adhaeribacter terrigena]MBK0403183.1 MmcQ/YjbR family DNA-binding protein [Adhaeribacter terrigena]